VAKEILHIDKIAAELNLKSFQIAAAINLLDDAATVPFIARYRKEATGGLDEVAIAAIRDRIGQLRELEKRRSAIINSLIERELLTAELRTKLEAAATLARLEDIYLPFRPKRRTRAAVARERGLEPLAEILFLQDDINPEAAAQSFVDPRKEIETMDQALAGARDIIAEWVSEDADARAALRSLYIEQAYLKSRVIADRQSEGVKYAEYFEREEPLKQVPSHRLLAVFRGEAEAILRVNIELPDGAAQAILLKIFIAADNAASVQVKLAIDDAIKRLLEPAMENEMRAEFKMRADREAIRIFADNLRELLLAPPLGPKDVMAIDPGFRTGCKLVCLDSGGKPQFHATIFPHGSDEQKRDAAAELKALCDKYKIKVIAIGNGTAGRETELYVRSLNLPAHISIELVDESGASVYSASAVARDEFPDYDITVRGAISIGRRLQDPLAELVKIEPESIGVGQYQHDVDKNLLRQVLDDTVISCVNAVGVDVNMASRQLLAYVSGLGPQLAKNIIAYRDEHGPYRSRAALRKVPRMGPRAFEQAAGFLRINNAANPLDGSAVHPESYHVVEKMAEDLACTVTELMSDEGLRQKIEIQKYATEKIGLPTLQDILGELARPGRDPRPPFESIKFNESVRTIEDLQIGMKLPGVVTNVTAFGAFVDIGIHLEGLIHKSQLADRYVNNPTEVIRVRQRVNVRIIGIDIERKRISLSMRDA